MNWILLAILASIFTSLSTISSKIALGNVKSNFATFLRTLFIVILSLIIVLGKLGLSCFSQLSINNIIFLTISGIFTGLSWLCFFKAMKLGDVNKVVAIDKCSHSLTTVLFLIFFFDATTNHCNPLTTFLVILSSILIIVGTIVMIEKKDVKDNINKTYLIYAILSAVFASLVSLFVKIGVTGVDSMLAILVRTIVVLIFSFIICATNGELKEFKKTSFTQYFVLFLSGAFTFFAWDFEYSALQDTLSNPVAISSITKASIVLTFIISFVFLKEKFNKKTIIGISILILGIILVVLSSIL